MLQEANVLSQTIELHEYLILMIYLKQYRHSIRPPSEHQLR